MALFVRVFGLGLRLLPRQTYQPLIEPLLGFVGVGFPSRFPELLDL